MIQCSQDKVVLKVGQRVRYTLDTDVRFYGNIEAIKGDRFFVRWDRYRDDKLYEHSKSELQVVPKNYGRY